MSRECFPIAGGGGSSTDSVAWLLRQGGPTVRYRTMTELAEGQICGSEVEAARESLLQDNTICRWLSNLCSYEEMVERTQRGEGLGVGGRSSFMHGSTDQNLEVVLPKLGQLGLCAGVPALDERVESWRRLLIAEMDAEYDVRYPRESDFLRRVYAHYDRRLIVVTSLALAGYRDPAIEQVFASRLAAIYEVVQQCGHDLFADPARVKVSPKAWSARMLKHDLYTDGNIKVPYVHDVLGWAVLYQGADSEMRARIDAVVQWMLVPGYQNLPYNCGYIQCPDGRGKSVGWKMNLPGYTGYSGQDFDPQALVLRCWQLAHLPAARSHPWFQSSMDHLEQFATGRGTYVFPLRYLTEAREQGYWVLGARMGLGEDRHHSLWREVESTFWMLSIQKATQM